MSAESENVFRLSDMRTNVEALAVLLNHSYSEGAKQEKHHPSSELLSASIWPPRIALWQTTQLGETGPIYERNT
jgi:hypothetical protein